MGKIIEFYDEELGGTMYIEVEENTEGFRQISNKGKFKGKIEDLLGTVKVFGKGVLRAVKELEPQEVEIRAGLKFEIREGHLVGVFAQAKAEFPFEISLKWKLDEETTQSEKPTV